MPQPTGPSEEVPVFAKSAETKLVYPRPRKPVVQWMADVEKLENFAKATENRPEAWALVPKGSSGEEFFAIADTEQISPRPQKPVAQWVADVEKLENLVKATEKTQQASALPPYPPGFFYYYKK